VQRRASKYGGKGTTKECPRQYRYGDTETKPGHAGKHCLQIIGSDMERNRS